MIKSLNFGDKTYKVNGYTSRLLNKKVVSPVVLGFQESQKTNIPEFGHILP